MAISDRLRRFLSDELSWNGSTESLTDDYPLLENGVLDSLGIFELVSFIESEYGIEIGDDDLLPENFASIERIANLIQTKKPEAV